MNQILGLKAVMHLLTRNMQLLSAAFNRHNSEMNSVEYIILG